jgi:hypothetical protein
MRELILAHILLLDLCSYKSGVTAGDGSHSTDQPKGTEVGHAGLFVGFSKVIPANGTSKAYPGLGIL